MTASTLARSLRAMRPSVIRRVATDMIDFSRNHFELFGLPQRFRFDRRAARRARIATLQVDVHPDRLRDRRRRAAPRRAAVVGARQRGVPRAQGSGAARAVPAARCTASTRSARPTRSCRSRSSSGSSSAARRRSDALGRRRRAARCRRCSRRCAATRAMRRTGSRGSSTASTRTPAARTRVRELTFLAKLAEDLDAMLGALDADGLTMALFQISEPGEAPAPHARKRAIGIDLGTTNSLVATVRNGLAVVLPDEEGRPLVPSIVRYAEHGVETGLRGDGAPGARSAEHDRVGQAADGARPRRPGRRAPLSVSVRRRAGHGAHRHARRREVAGRGVRRPAARAARARRGVARRRRRRRRRHGARVLRRRAAPGDQGCRAARRVCRCCAC